MATGESKHFAWKIVGLVLLALSVAADILGVSTFTWSPAVKITVWVCAGVAIVILLLAFVGSILAWIDDFFLAIRLVLNIHRPGTPKSLANHFRDHVKKLMKERPANQAEVNKVIIEAPMLGRSPPESLQKNFDQIRQELSESKIVWRREHEVGGRRVEYDFDVFQFSTASKTRLDITMTHIKNDIQHNFERIKFDTVIHLLREEQHYGLSPFFDEIQKFMHFDSALGFLLPTRKWELDPLFMSSLARECDGKSVLLVEPIMIDTGLDKAYKTIRQAGGRIEGLLILFEVKGFRRESLENHRELMAMRGANGLRGQIVLDLHETH